MINTLFVRMMLSVIPGAIGYTRFITRQAAVKNAGPEEPVLVSPQRSGDFR